MGTKEDLRIQVMMVGGRRCGKTSILAAMQSNFQELLADTDLTLVCSDMDTLSVLDAKHNEIDDYFNNMGNRTFIPDNNPTEEIMTYSFFIGIAGKTGKIRVDYIDYPGEWLKYDKKKKKELLKCIEKSQAIIIAIDTPHMMEEEGQYNELQNFCNYTEEILKMAFENTKKRMGLILFVPLKCERYLMTNEMDEVSKRTEESYEELIRYLKKAGKFEVAVTPIFTLGGAAFSKFERDEETKKVKLNEKFGTPEKAIYCFPKMEVKGPEPRYCEQPMVYLLAYLLQLAGDIKENTYQRSNFLSKLVIILQQKLGESISAMDYGEQRSVILEKLKRNGDGYRIIQNPMKF